MPTPSRMATSETVDGASADDTSLLGRTRNISPSGLGLELPAQVERVSVLKASLKLPGLSSPASQSIDIRVEMQSCRPRGERWTIGAHIVDSDDEARRRIVEYCYLVSQRDRLRGPQPILLPAPVEMDPPSRLRLAA